MGQKKLSRAEREQIYQKKASGDSLPEIAEELNISYECVRKWWRRFRDEGLSGLEGRKRGRKAKGMLSGFDDKVVAKSLELKQTNRLSRR